jgi:hypothetical protein
MTKDTTNDEWGNIELSNITDEKLFNTNWNKVFGNKIAGQTRKKLLKNDVQRKKQMSIVRKTMNDKNYSNKLVYILRSPGNDLLDFYDQQNNLLGKENRAHSVIPPSVVYHYRFEHEYPLELFDKSKNYGRFSYLRDQLKKYYVTYDNTYWGQVYRSRYEWLINSPSEQHTFFSKKDLDDFCFEKFNQKNISGKLVNFSQTDHTLVNDQSEHMFWRGLLKGWSVISMSKEKYEQLTNSSI